MRLGNRRLVGLAAALVLAAAVWLPASAGSTSSTHAHKHTMSAELPPGAFTQESIYQLASTWTTESERRMQLGELRGKARVLVMNYTTCEYACPILISIIKNVEKALEPEVLDNVGFVAVSFDPERDTPAVLKAYSDKMRLDLDRWTLLHGEPEDVLELAVLLGVKFKKDQHGGFAHSNLITVLNQEGEIVHRHTGLNHNVAETIAAIRRVAGE